LDKIAIISDVHGNIPALEAVLDDIHNRGIELICNLGDLVGKGANSDVSIDMCREVCQVVVRGNWDESIAVAANDALADWYRTQIGVERIAYLGSLPNAYDFMLSGKRVRLYHASHIGVFHRVHMIHPAEVHAAMFTNTDFTGFENPEPDIVGYGDIHASYMHVREHKILFNAGSVGNPLDMPLATYAVLNGTLGSEKPASFSIDFVRLPYDVERAIEDGRKVDLPELEYYAVELRTSLYRGHQKAKK
jgi:protein phosphatase